MKSIFVKVLLSLGNLADLLIARPKHRKTSTQARAVSAFLLVGLVALGSIAPTVTNEAKASNVFDLNYAPISFGQDADLTRANSNLVVGFNRMYSNVVSIGGQSIDARVTLNYVEGHSGNEIATFDEYDNGPNFSFHTQVNGTSSSQASARFKIEFFKGGTLEPVVINNLRASIADIDAWERAAFYYVSSYTLADPTSIVVASPSPTYVDFTSSASGTSNTDQSRMVQVTYDAASAISVWAGCKQNAVNNIGSNGLCGFTVNIGAAVFTGATVNQTVAPASFTINYDANTGSGSAPATASVSGVTAISDPTNLSKAGFVFDGWSTTADGTGTRVDPGDSYLPHSSSVTFFAQWVPASSPSPTPTPTPIQSQSPFTVNFLNNGGSGSMVDQVSSVSAGLSANTFTRTGYDFAGWNTAADGTGTSYSDASTYGFGSNLSLYAMWTPSASPSPAPSVTPTPAPTAAATPYTVNFVNNGGSGSMADQTSAVATGLSSNSFTRNGFSFSGWNTMADGSGTTYADASNYAFTANLTLFALWTPNANQPVSPPVTTPAQTLPHTVTFVANGGSGSMNSQTSMVPAGLASNQFERAGFKFAGWNTSADGSGTQVVDADNYAFQADMTLYAQWIAVELEPTALPENTGDELAYTGAADTAALLLLALALFVAGVAIRFAPSPKRRR